MVAHVLLNLLNEFNKFNNTRFYLSYDIKYTLNLISAVKTL